MNNVGKEEINQRREKNIRNEQLCVEALCSKPGSSQNALVWRRRRAVFFFFFLMVQCSDEEPSFVWIVGSQC